MEVKSDALVGSLPSVEKETRERSNRDGGVLWTGAKIDERRYEKQYAPGNWRQILPGRATKAEKPN